ncbi:MAG: aldo/keto reductase [Pseudomonadota bacterium]
MKQATLYEGGPSVGVVGYGAMSFTNFYGDTTDEQSKKILDACVELGIDHIDTSNVYGMGRSETVIGEWLKSRGENPFFIATKGGIQRDPARRFNNDRAHLTEALEASLTRLGVEAVDLYYVHRKDPAVEIEETAETLAGFVKAGKAKAVGFSEIAPSTLRRAEAVTKVHAVQSEYSLQTRSPELGLNQTCEELGAALVAFSPVGRGLLTDEPPNRAKTETLDFLKNNPRFMEPNISANLRVTEPLRKLAAEMGEATATLACAWCVAKGTFPIPGTRSVEHLRHCARGGEIELSADDVARIEAALPVGSIHGDRYSEAQWGGPEKYC